MVERFPPITDTGFLRVERMQETVQGLMEPVPGKQKVRISALDRFPKHRNQSGIGYVMADALGCIGESKVAGRSVAQGV